MNLGMIKILNLLADLLRKSCSEIAALILEPVVQAKVGGMYLFANLFRCESARFVNNMVYCLIFYHLKSLRDFTNRKLSVAEHAGLGRQ